MLRHSFLLAVFAGALACGALADDEGQEPPICDGKGQSSCNKKVEDDGSSTSVSFIQSALKIEIERADSEEEGLGCCVWKPVFIQCHICILTQRLLTSFDHMTHGIRVTNLCSLHLTQPNT